MNILFICSRNKWRSKTAEEIFKNLNGYTVRSAGTSESARIKVTEKHLLWADLIFVMEKKHKVRLKEKFPAISKEVMVLNIPDDYQYMDEELIALLTSGVAPYLNS